MLKSFQARRLARKGDILEALKLLPKDPEVLVRSQLYISLLNLSSPPPYYKAFALSQIGNFDEACKILSNLDLSSYQKLSPSLRLPIIQKLTLYDQELALKFSKALIPDFPDFHRLLSGSSSFDDPLLQINQHLDQGDLNAAEQLWLRFFASHQLNAPKFPIDGEKLSLKKIVSHCIDINTSKTTPLVSIVVSAYNASNHLTVSLQSLLNQTHKNIEIIVIDDASTDETTQTATNILKIHESKHKVITLKENRGSYAARNVGLKEAKGEFIMNHDADDWAHPEKVSLQLNSMRDSSTMASVSRWIKISKHNGRLGTHYTFPLLRHCTNSILFRSSILHHTTGYDEVRAAADEKFETEIKATFGEKALKKLKLPLTIGNLSENTITSSKTEGMTSSKGLRARVEYREKWLPLLLDKQKQN